MLACPYKCLWAGAVEPPDLADVLVYDCLQLPPRGGHAGRQALMLMCMAKILKSTLLYIVNIPGH